MQKPKIATEITFDHFEEILEAFDVEIDGAYAHGLLCGCLTGGLDINAKTWPEYLLDIDFDGFASDVASHKEVLTTIYEVSEQSLRESDFDFQLLLPEDDTPLPLRVEALSDWCAGYLSGLGLCDIGSDLPDDCLDAIAQLTEIVDVDIESVTASEEEEPFFIEIREYVRVAVMLLYTEILLSNTAESEEASEPITIH